MKTIRRKLIVVGDVRCGKSSLIWAFSHPSPVRYSIPYVLDARITEFTFDNVTLELGIWDADSYEDFARLRPLMYIETDVILLAFSIDSPKSLWNASTKWYREVRSACGPNVPIFLVGCKSDLRSGLQNGCLVPREGAETVAAMIGACRYYECSAFSVDGVSLIMEDAARASMEVEQGRDGNQGIRCVVC